jgi:hypothetical protein
MHAGCAVQKYSAEWFGLAAVEVVGGEVLGL